MADYETLHVCRLHMRDGAIHYKLYVLKLTMAVDNIVFRIIKGAFKCSYRSLMYVFLYNTIKWQKYQPKHSPSRILAAVKRNGEWIRWTYKDYYNDVCTTAKAFIRVTTPQRLSRLQLSHIFLTQI